MAKDYVDQISTNVDGAKANIASSLQGYGILDAFTKDEVNALVDTAVSAIVGMAPAQLDTLKEIADKIALSDSDIAGILSVLEGKAALSQVYERGVIDTKLDTKADNASTLSGYGIADAYTKTQSDASLALKAEKNATYTKTEMDVSLSGKLGKLETAVSASKLSAARTINLTGDVTGSVAFDGNGDVSMTTTVINDSHSHAFSALSAIPSTLAGHGIADAYTKTQSDASLALKAEKNATYTKTEMDASLALKAEKNETYTKTETDGRIQAIVGAAPAALDTLQEIAAQLANDESAVSALTGVVSTKADAASVYTKTEIDGKFNQYADANLSALTV
jgi:hypothetical protein